jgi:hypothetical protein
VCRLLSSVSAPVWACVRPPCRCRLGRSSSRRRLALPARSQDRDADGRGRPPGRRPGRRRRTRASRYPPPGSACGPLCLRGRGPGRPTGRARDGRGEAACQRCQERRPSGVATVIEGTTRSPLVCVRGFRTRPRRPQGRREGTPLPPGWASHALLVVDAVPDSSGASFQRINPHAR